MIKLQTSDGTKLSIIVSTYDHKCAEEELLTILNMIPNKYYIELPRIYPNETKDIT